LIFKSPFLSFGMDSFDEHEEREKRRRWKTAVTIGVGILLAVFLVFFDTFYHLVTYGHLRKGSFIDKVGGRLARVSPEEESAILTEARRLLQEGKINEARERALYIIGRMASSEALNIVGLTYLRQGNVKGAYDYFRESVRVNPKNYSAQERLGEIFVLVGDYQSAKKQAEVLGGIKEYAPDGLLLEAEIAVREGNYSQALNKVNAAFAVREPSPKEQIFLAHLYYRLGEKKRAGEIIGKLDLERMDAEGYLSLARYYVSTGEDEKAKASYSLALKRYPSNAEVLYNYGMYLIGQRKFAEAASYLEQAHRAFPGAAIVTYRMGQAYLAAGKSERVAGLIAELLTQDPQSILAWRLKGEYAMAKGERRQAIEAFNKVVQFIPEASFIYALLSELYLKEGDGAQAEKYARRAIELGDSSFTPRMVLGDILYRQGRWEEARARYYEVMKIQPGNLAALIMAGDCELNLGNLKKAEELYRKAITLYPHLSFIEARFARVKLAAGDRSGALAATRSYYEKNPKDPKAVAEYANTLLVNGRTDEASRVLEEGMKRIPQDGYLPLVAGDLELFKGDLEGAARMYARAEAAKETNPNHMINIAARYVAMQRLTDAQRLYLKAVSLYPADIQITNEAAWFFIDILKKPEMAKEMVEVLKKKGEGANEKDTIGWYYFLTGNEKTAEYYLREARELDPRNPIIQAHYALVLEKMSRLKEAKEEAIKARDKLPPGDLKKRIMALCEAKGP